MAEAATIPEILAEVGQTQQDFLSILDQASEDVLYRRPADEEGWTLAEVLAHITEARQFWSNDIRRIQASPGLKVGRTADHPGRLQAVREHGQDSIAAFRNRFVTGYELVVETLKGVTEEDLQIKLEHISAGPQTLGEFIQRFIVGHDRVHVEQAQRLLAKGTQPQ
jgi:uncharacterized damage-inducible protein DinB